MNNISVVLDNQTGNSERCQSMDLQPWNSGRVHRITAQLKGRVQRNKKNAKAISDIFCLSNRSSGDRINGPPQEGRDMKGINLSNIHQKSKSLVQQLAVSIQKPKTAPYNRRKYPPKKAVNQTDISQQLSKLGLVPTDEILNEEFEDNLESINFYPQFRSSIQPRKNMLFLQPHLKSVGNRIGNKTCYNYESQAKNVSKMKTQIYRQIKRADNSNAQMQECNFCKNKLLTNPNSNIVSSDPSVIDISSSSSPQIHNNPKHRIFQPNKNIPIKQKIMTNCECYLLSHRSVIEYLTEYEGDNQYEQFPVSAKEIKNGKKYKNGSISVLREKLKSRYKDSKYLNNIQRIKYGRGIPVTILQ